jgi:polyribonucleotide nucleotidyltransferase
MIELQIDSIAMVEGEMKEISEAEMVEAIKFAHEHISQTAAQERLASIWKKKKFVPTKEKEKMKLFTKKVKAASYDKIGAIAVKVRLNTNVQLFDKKEEVKRCY